MKSVKQSFHLLALLRPFSWIKNILIFVPLFFAKDFFIYSKLSATILSFVIFCIAASLVYILNDIFDVEQDRKHEIKKNRPIASGEISVKYAVNAFLALLIIDIALIYFFIPSIAWLVGLYLILNIIYSKYLKHVAVLDIILVSSFYFIRIMVGGIAAGVPISRWLLLCIIFISLFMIVGKRLAEFRQEHKRPVLLEYNLEFLNAMLVVSATLIIISYSLYSVIVVDSNMAILSIFLVLLGMVRYLFLVFTSHRAEYPEKVVFTDRIIFFSTLLWTLAMFLIIYLNV